MVASIVSRTLFTKLERLLIRNQARPFVIKDKKTELETIDSDSPDQIDEKTYKSKITQSQHFYRLCEGVRLYDMPPID